MKLPLCAASLVALAAVAAACGSSSKKSHHNPLPVYDDVYVTGHGANRIVVDGDTLWVVNSLDDTVDQVDLTSCTTESHSCQRVKRIQFPTGTDPFDLAVANGFLWVPGNFANAVYKVDTGTGAIVATITTGDGHAFNGPESPFVVGTNLFVSNANFDENFSLGPGFVSIVDVLGTTITGQFATTQKDPVGFAPWIGGDYSVTNNGVADFSSGTGVATTAGGIDVFDATGQIVQNVDLGLTLPGPLTVLSTDGQYGFTGSGNGAELIRVDTATGIPATTQFSSAATFSSDVVVDGTTVFLLSYREDRIYAVDVNTLQPVFLNTAGQPTSFVTVGPGGATPKGPVWAAVWHHDGVKHLLVLLTGADSITDVILP